MASRPPPVTCPVDHRPVYQEKIQDPLAPGRTMYAWICRLHGVVHPNLRRTITTTLDQYLHPEGTPGQAAAYLQHAGPQPEARQAGAHPALDDGRPGWV